MSHLPDTNKTEPQRSGAPDASHTRLRGYWLVAARAAWVAMTGLTVLLLVKSFPLYLEHALRGAGEFEIITLYLGLSSASVAWYTVALTLATLAVFMGVAVVLFWRGSNDRMAILTSLMLVTFGATVTQPLAALAATSPAAYRAVTLVYAAGTSSLVAFIYLFPRGQFIPGWTRPAAMVYTAWMFAPFFLPGVISHPFIKFEWWGFLLNLGWYASGMAAHHYREKQVYTPTERQQTRWIMLGLMAALLSFVITGIRFLVPLLNQPGVVSALGLLLGFTLGAVGLSLVPVSIGLSITQYRLWDIDVFINRALVYGAVTATLGAAYWGSVVLLQRLFQDVIGRQSELAIIVSTLVIAALFQPWRQRLQDFVDRRFYRERVDARRAITDFTREVRAIIELPELLRALATRTTDLLHIAHGAVFLRGEDGKFRLAEARWSAPERWPTPSDQQVTRLTQAIDAFFLYQLQKGVVVSRPSDAVFPLLVPLIAPRSLPGGRARTVLDARDSLAGVLALGPRLSGQGYSREDEALLLGLADQAGAAIYVARLIAEKEAEKERKEEAERRWEAYRNSPIGRAEAMAQLLLDQPEMALIELHALAQSARNDPDAASLLANLPQALAQKPTSGEQGDLRAWLGGVAEGLNYLFTSWLSPELLPVGLRTLLMVLPSFTLASRTGQADRVVKGSAEALAVYQLCQAALDANSIAQITQLSDLRLRIADIVADGQRAADVPQFLADLAYALSSLQLVIDTLRAYERVDTTQDKLAYLAGAVERLRQADRAAHGLGGADRPIARRIVESWLGIVAGAMSELQARAQLVCQLLTRRARAGDVTSLALGLRNEGRGAALNLRIALAPAPDYTALGEAVYVERLAPGEETQAELQARLRGAGQLDQFRARFVVHYDDPRGLDQVENFADAVYLWAAEGEFRFISNPYVVGTPLQAGSPLFFGRDDVVAFIQDNLSAAHRNNLVLIGQRRTGKTSLLKQLPTRLGNEHVPVYLDGQSLALDPGLPNFFLALATEIAFVLEDRGMDIEPPDPGDFASPAAAFERGFLARVRQAMGGRHLLLLLDEFEELEAAVRRGSLDDSIFAFLRHVIQHVEGLSIIFCGTHRLEELSADYWSVLFNISLYRHIAYLEKPHALRLIQEPVAEYGMRYDDLALDKLWRVTAGHPYFLQLVCHSLVNRHNKTRCNYVTIADVNAALEDILASGEAHFVYLWSSSTPTEKLALAALSRMMPLTGRANPAQVLDYLVGRGVSAERQPIGEALHHLALRDILEAGAEADAALGETYRWRLGLLGLWVEKYKSFSRVVDEVEQ